MLLTITKREETQLTSWTVSELCHFQGKKNGLRKEFFKSFREAHNLTIIKPMNNNHCRHAEPEMSSTQFP